LGLLGVLAVVAAVLWVTGGLKETPKQPVKQPGKALDLGLFTVTVRDARIGTADAGFGSEQERFLIVRMRVENRGKETEQLGTGGLADGVVALTKTGQWVKPDEVEGTAGGAETDVVQPGLPVEASAMWKLGPANSPQKLTVGLRIWKYEHGFTDSGFNWIVQHENDVLAGRLTLPVAPMTEPATEQPGPGPEAPAPAPTQPPPAPPAPPAPTQPVPRPTVSGS